MDVDRLLGQMTLEEKIGQMCQVDVSANDVCSRLGDDLRAGRIGAVINPVDPATVDWKLYPRQGFPYMIRQRPGPANALGRLKIMFPNEHMVYLHDTPSRELFNRSERTFSSGCIRVENAEQLAVLVLDDPGQWDLAAVNAVIAGKQTRRVSLREPLPIYLVY